MKVESKKKRFLINSLSILVILVVIIAVVKSAPSKDAPFDTTDVPSLKVASIVDLSMRSDSRGDRISIALIRSDKTTTAGVFIQDILTVYKWANTHFAPVKCGDDYPKDLCRIGFVEVWLLVPLEDVPLVGGGKVDVYQTMIKFGLDQIQIEKLLKSEILTVNDLVDFHQSVAQGTQGTGGGNITTDYVNVFLGFNK